MKVRRAFGVFALVMYGMTTGMHAQQQQTDLSKPKVPLVSVVGCATQMSDGTWMLTKATEGIESKVLFMGAKEIEEAKTKPWHCGFSYERRSTERSAPGGVHAAGSRQCDGPAPERPQASSQGPSHHGFERKTIEPRFRAAIGRYVSLIRDFGSLRHGCNELFQCFFAVASTCAIRN